MASEQKASARSVSLAIPAEFFTWPTLRESVVQTARLFEAAVPESTEEKQWHAEMVVNHAIVIAECDEWSAKIMQLLLSGPTEAEIAALTAAAKRMSDAKLRNAEIITKLETAAQADDKRKILS
jgi:hypothetical protein